MDISRRSFVVGSVFLLAGCTGNSSEANQQPTSTPTETPTETTRSKCNPKYVEDTEDRTEYALGLYEDAYDGMNNSEDEIGAVIESDGLYATQEEGPDANHPDGLILEEREGGDVLITLVDLSDSALSDMRNDRFHDAIEGFRGAQGALESNIGSWQNALEFVNDCEINDNDLFPQPIQNGISSAEHLKAAAAKFEEECKAYLDNDATFEEDVSDASQLQEEGVEELREAAATYPRTPQSLEDEVLVYRSD
ncbi:hypothetical protein GCM10009037_10660 [Halarchaeum grantii]|jgi:hypothetical protein|uniref:Uncharacterized protein n=1 Tax=Halarchaeum grantii TaxID=1193105 RepID=A0A830F0Z3_9EURY|nr:hypothetical protein [Halarchaeum grantii]GGL28855.1 hypothetical protein GCM10009037_10660 [Halarchaeum grantii]